MAEWSGCISLVLAYGDERSSNRYDKRGEQQEVQATDCHETEIIVEPVEQRGQTPGKKGKEGESRQHGETSCLSPCFALQ